MKPELVLCIPGPWKDRTDFIRQVITTTEPKGSFVFAGQILLDVTAKDHVEVDFCDRDDRMQQAFKFAGQGRLSEETLALIANHAAVVYLHFPLDIQGQAPRLTKFSNLLRKCGGFGVKVESSGISHDWDRWLSLLDGTAFDRYCSAVVLIGDKQEMYSCGMHNFGHRDVEVPASLGSKEAAALMNRFNMWLIEESPTFQAGHTFSVDRDSPRYRINARDDTRHHETLHRNPHGLWSLVPAT